MVSSGQLTDTVVMEPLCATNVVNVIFRFSGRLSNFYLGYISDHPQILYKQVQRCKREWPQWFCHQQCRKYKPLWCQIPRGITFCHEGYWTHVMVIAYFSLGSQAIHNVATSVVAPN